MRTMTLMLGAALLLSSALPSEAAPPDQAAIRAQVGTVEQQVIAWRRDIHQHPELGNREVRTSKIVADHLLSLGLGVRTGVAHTGVVGVLKGGRPGPVVALRADMDALPVTEREGLPFASKVKAEYNGQQVGVMHACGHDAHTAILLGVARLLTALPDRPAGEVRFLFQPSEESADAENKSGAQRMIDDQALAGVDAVIALHVDSNLPSGQLSVGDGYTSANEDSFEIWLHGTGGHGAFPHQGIDPTFILAQLLNALHGIRARRIDPTKAAALSIGRIQAGTVANVIPHQVYLNGTMRSFEDGVRQQLRSELSQALELSRVLGGDYTLALRQG